MPFVWTGEMYVRPAGRGIDLEGLAPPESDCDRTDLGEVLPRVAGECGSSWSNWTRRPSATVVTV